jgi:hypothetical protein
MEGFKRGWWGWIRSSEGYSVRLMGRTRLQYRDALGNLEIYAEPMGKPWSDVVVDSSTIPDLPDRPRTQVLDRLHRAFTFAGWRLIESNGSVSED